MKFAKTISKNFKILFRIKTSLIDVIFGPILVIFLIGLAFNSSSDIQLSVGYVNPDNSSLSNEFISVLNDEDYILQPFMSQEACTSQLKRGLLHTCIMFPNDFVIREGKTNQILFVVDKSRISIVYTVIESVSERIGIKSEQLSKDLTDTLTTTLSTTGTLIDDSIGKIIIIKSNAENSESKAQTIEQNTNDMDLESVSFPSGISSTVANLRGYTHSIASEVEDVVDDVSSNVSGSVENVLNDLNDYVQDKDNSSLTDYTGIETKLEQLDSSISSAESQLNRAKALNEENLEHVGDVSSSLSTINAKSGEVKQNLESISYDISSIEITSTEQIVNPVTTKIETISTDANQLAIMFPYVLMLIVMFVGMLLAATLVVVEKRSRAAFRVFTSPTKDEFYILTTFITAFLVVAAQIIVTLLITNLVFVDLFTENLVVNGVLLAIASSMFIMMGMAIGYLFSNQQGANMTCISVGAVLLFISNMVMPLESVAPALRGIAQYNPYVLSSEMLRQSILFATSFNDLFTELVILLGYAVVILILLITFQKLSKAIYFKKKASGFKHKHKPRPSISIDDYKVVSEKDFIIAINRLTDEEFTKIMKKRGKTIKNFVRKELRNPSLAKKLTKKSKEKIISELAHQHEERFKKLKERHEEIHKKKDSSDEKYDDEK